MTIRNRRRLRRWFGWALVTVGAIGLVHPDLPGLFPLLVGVALLNLGSGRARRLMRRIDGWWRGSPRGPASPEARSRVRARRHVQGESVTRQRAALSCWRSGRLRIKGEPPLGLPPSRR